MRKNKLVDSFLIFITTKVNLKTYTIFKLLKKLKRQKSNEKKKKTYLVDFAANDTFHKMPKNTNTQFLS